MVVAPFVWDVAVWVSIFASLAGAVAIVLTGLMARELSGGRGAQLFAACAVSSMAIATGTLMQYVSFDYLAWVAVAFFMARLCRTNDARWWLAVGATVGFGMLSKYSMAFLVAGIAVWYSAASCGHICAASGFGSAPRWRFDFSPEPALAMAARFHFAAISPAHPRARCPHRPDEKFFAGPINADFPRAAGGTVRIAFLFFELRWTAIPGAGVSL